MSKSKAKTCVFPCLAGEASVFNMLPVASLIFLFTGSRLHGILKKHTVEAEGLQLLGHCSAGKATRVK